MASPDSEPTRAAGGAGEVPTYRGPDAPTQGAQARPPETDAGVTDVTADAAGSQVPGYQGADADTQGYGDVARAISDRRIELPVFVPEPSRRHPAVLFVAVLLLAAVCTALVVGLVRFVGS